MSFQQGDLSQSAGVILTTQLFTPTYLLGVSNKATYPSRRVGIAINLDVFTRLKTVSNKATYPSRRVLSIDPRVDVTNGFHGFQQGDLSQSAGELLLLLSMLLMHSSFQQGDLSQSAGGFNSELLLNVSYRTVLRGLYLSASIQYIFEPIQLLKTLPCKLSKLGTN